MSAFRTTDEQFVHAARVAAQMEIAGLHVGFIAAALNLARLNRGAYELMALWEEAYAAKRADECDETVADLEELIGEHVEQLTGPTKKPYIRFDQLDNVGQRVLAHKQLLRELIDRNGGVSRVAELSGIPQPSLSRMLNSASMPRRTTLYRLANALNISETEIVGDFTW